MIVYIVVCSLWAGIDPGIDLNYVPSYHVNYFENIKELTPYLEKNPNCRLFKAEQLKYSLQSKTVLKEHQEIIGVEIEEKKK
jgi:hypothetical protein